MEHRKLIFSVLTLCFGLTTKAQQSTNTSGGNASGGGGTLAYSVGQVVYTTNVSSAGNVAQGVQQAYEIFTIDIKETAFNISLTAFPNPTADYLNLMASDYNNEKLSYQLFDMQGKLLIDRQIVAAQTQITMFNLPTATYFLNVVTRDNTFIKSFRIVKQ